MKVFDTTAFLEAVEGIRRSGQAGISASTLTRMSQGHDPSIQTAAKLARWAGVSLDRFGREVS